MRRRVLGFGDCCYHVVSRINERRFYLGEKQKRHFLELLHSAATFSGVEVLTYCIMDDHFHLLVRVPRPKAIRDKELFMRLKALYRPYEYDALCLEYERYQKMNDEEMMHAFRQRFLHRMYDLSEFVRTLKHRFSLWFNKNNDREGPLWTGRFKSVLVQSSADEFGCRALGVIAAYIDLNAVRAGLVEKAKDYAWCSFARISKGDRKQMEALKYMLGRSRRGRISSKMALKTYQKLLNDGFSSKMDCFSSGWIVGQSSFVDFVARRRPECFRTGFFELTEEIADLPETGISAVKNTRLYASQSTDRLLSSS